MKHIKAEHKYKINCYKLLFFFFGTMFLVSSVILAAEQFRNIRQEQSFEEIRQLFVRKATPAAPLKVSPQSWSSWWDAASKERFAVYQAIVKEHPDVTGWIRIEGTPIDYPVCQTPDNPDYYLYRDINGNNSSYGTPFLDGACRLEQPRSNLLIYGHHMKNGQMFASLEKYTDIRYFREHPYVQFDTPKEAASYEIAAAVKLDAAGNQVPWQKLLFPAEETEFHDAYALLKNKQFYDTGVGIAPDDELLALVTCEYSQTDGRLMVLARRIQKN